MKAINNFIIEKLKLNKQSNVLDDKFKHHTVYISKLDLDVDYYEWDVYDEYNDRMPTNDFSNYIRFDAHNKMWTVAVQEVYIHVDDLSKYVKNKDELMKFAYLFGKALHNRASETDICFYNPDEKKFIEIGSSKNNKPFWYEKDVANIDVKKYTFMKQ